MFLLGRGKRVRFVITVPAAIAIVAGVMVAAAVPGTATAASRPDGVVSDPAALVDPMIGTGSGGATVGQIDTFPGASAPFGMLTLSPDTPSRPGRRRLQLRRQLHHRL